MRDKSSVLRYNSSMNKGQFKKGEHWREHKPYWDKDWLEKEYSIKSCGDIASEWGVTEAAILFWLRKHGIKRRTISEARSLKHWGCSGSDNPMFGKGGELNQNWRGGCTPERQSVYVSQEWKSAVSFIYKRDNATCQRCGMKGKLHVHHIVSFAEEEYRVDPDNLVLLCVKCHRFVHSKKNIEREFIVENLEKGGI